MNQYAMSISKKNNLRCPNGMPYTYQIFFFDQEPLSLWRVSVDGSEITEFIETMGWAKNVDYREYRSDIQHSISNISAYYHELPMVILGMLEGFPC